MIHSLDRQKDLAVEISGSIERYINPRAKTQSSDSDSDDDDDVDDDGAICEGNLILEDICKFDRYSTKKFIQSKSI